MNNLIYQMWDGNITVGVRAGVEAMKKYASIIGAKYLFEDNPKFVNYMGKYSPHYGKFKPIYDSSFHQYDNVLVVDTDVFPVEGLKDNIFENFSADVGLCTEPFQPEQRRLVSGPIDHASDEKWASIVEKRWNVKMPRTIMGLLTVYNTGVVLYSNKGLKKAKEKFIPFRDYLNLIGKQLSPFYTCDQPYLHAMLKVVPMDYVELDNDWNRYIHYYYTDNTKKQLAVNDSRTNRTKFVHIQLRDADNWDADKLWRVTNLLRDEWKL